MKASPFPKSISFIFFLSLIYWVYLSLTTQMAVIFDSVGYQNLGRMIEQHGWIPYFTSGPNREPLYPWLVSISMNLEHLTGLAYIRFMAFFGVIILLITQLLTYQILRLFNIRIVICLLILGYLAISPALNNAAFSLYSEIAAFPFVLGIVLISFNSLESILHSKRIPTLINGAFLGILLAAATLVKAVFECISPIYLISFFIFAIGKNKGRCLKNSTLFLFAALSFYYLPITSYKWLNLQYNGNFAITDRGSWALYGNTTRRMEPLTLKRFAEALAFTPGAGVCDNIFGSKECDFWSFKKSDEFAFAKLDALSRQHLSSQKINSALLEASVQKALINPFQYALLTLVEGLKMFFFESTKIGFVTYPPWLSKIYDFKIFNNALRFLVSLITFIAVISLWGKILKPQTSPLNFILGTIIFFYILFFSFFFILTRYALPIAPLYLISIGLWLENLIPKKRF